MQGVDGERRRTIGMEMEGRNGFQRLVSLIWETLILWILNIELCVSVRLFPLLPPLFIDEVSLKFMNPHTKHDLCA